MSRRSQPDISSFIIKWDHQTNKNFHEFINIIGIRMSRHKSSSQIICHSSHFKNELENIIKIIFFDIKMNLKNNQYSVFYCLIWQKPKTLQKMNFLLKFNKKLIQKFLEIQTIKFYHKHTVKHTQ